MGDKLWDLWELPPYCCIGDPNNHACISSAHPAVLPQCHLMNNNTEEKEEQEEDEDPEPQDDKGGEEQEGF